MISQTFKEEAAMTRLSWIAGCLGFTLAVKAGCSGDDRARNLSLLREKKDQRLRQMQLVRVIDVTDPDNPVTREVDPSVIADAVDLECFHASNNDLCASEILDFGSLEGCRARLLLAAALPQTS